MKFPQKFQTSRIICGFSFNLLRKLNQTFVAHSASELLAPLTAGIRRLLAGVPEGSRGAITTGNKKI